MAGDIRPYRERAAAIAAGDVIGTEVFFDAPLYPYFLALSGGRAGTSGMTTKIAQALIDTATAFLVYRITLTIFGAGPALIALLLYGLYGFVLFYCGILLKPVIAIFALVAAFSLLLGHRWKSAGFLLGLGALFRGNFVFLAPLFLLYAAKGRGGNRRAGIALLAAFALPIFSVTIRNAVVGGDFVLLTYHAGPTFYHGNHPGADGTYAPIVPGRQNAGYEKSDAVRLAEEKRGRPLKPSEINRFWFGEAFRFIGADPIRFARLSARRAFLFWSGREIPDTFDFYLYRNLFPLLNVAIVPFGILAPLALLGWFIPSPLRGRALLLPGAVLSLFLSLVFLFVFGRYRLPAVPFLVPPAARFLFFAGRRASRSSGRATALLIVLLALAAMAVANGFSPVEDRATGLYNLGIRMERLGRLSEAEALYRDAVEESPRFAGAWNNLGALLLRAGAREEAEDAFRKALAADGGHHLATRNLAVILRGRREYDEARRLLEASLRRERSAATLAEIGVVDELSGRKEEAIRVYDDAVRLDSTEATACANLGRLLYEKGDVRRAIPLLRRGAARLAGEALPAVYLALAHLAAGDTVSAMEVVDRRLAGGPGTGECAGDSSLLLLKARLLALRGDGDGARDALRAARGGKMPSGELLRRITGGENLDDWGLRK